MDTLVGHAEDELVQLTMECGGTSYSHRSAGSLRLRLEHGELVQLDLAQAQVVPNVDARDDFGALLEQGLATPFLGDAPADHVSVHITGVSRPSRGRWPKRDHVRVVARPTETDDGLEVRSTGTDSLFLLASRRRPARAAARRAFALHGAALVSLLAIATSALVLALVAS